MTDRTWPDRELTAAPLWCAVDLRDGNQALPMPMGPATKLAYFRLLQRIGFKEIEAGYPSSNAREYEFFRTLATEVELPDDLTVVAFTPARDELIARTVDALAGLPRAMVHLCVATAPRWRNTVLGLSVDELRALIVRSAEQILRLAGDDARIRFEFSPEGFVLTELDVALDVCNAVIERWDASEDRPVTINLPATIETTGAHHYADQIEYMERHLARRSAVVLSLHPHNDRGTGVAAAELALRAGADRVEGCLFGNGERAGNVCLVTLALNLMSQGVDPMLDLSEIDEIRDAVESYCNLAVSPRHPYAGELVYTAFSGTHQDAIRKGLADQARRDAAAPGGVDAWDVPYLAIDPAAVGRTLDNVIRITSQSGKGGIAHVFAERHALELPVGLQRELAAAAKHRTEATGGVLGDADLLELLAPFVYRAGAAMEVHGGAGPGSDHELSIDGRVVCRLAADEPLEAEAAELPVADPALARLVLVHHLQERATADGRRVAYTLLADGAGGTWGVGLAPNAAGARLTSFAAAWNRLPRRTQEASLSALVGSEG